MELLRTVGWADVATRQDLDTLYHRTEALVYRELGTLRSEVHAELGALHKEVGGIRDEITRQTRTIIASTVGTMAVGLARLAG